MENAKDRSDSYKEVLTRKFNQEESEYVMYGDTIPLLRGLVNVPIEIKSLRKKDLQMFDGVYSKIFIRPYEGERWYINGIRKAYPINYINNPSFPDCAFINVREGYLVYDLEGNLKHFISGQWLDVYYEEKEALKEWCYMKDFTENKYNIRSQGPEVVKAVENLLKNDEGSKYLERLRAAQMVAAIGALVARDVNELKEVSDAVNNELHDATEDYLDQISKEARQRASAYVTQLKYDHSDDEFHFGRIKRTDSTSYYQSFVDGDGKCTHLVKIEYVQTAPFEAERKFTIIK